MTRPYLIRTAALLTALALSCAGGHLFLRFTGAGGLSALDIARAILVVITGFWLVWGGAAAVMGVFTPARAPSFDPRRKPVGMTAILVPIFNENPAETFARIAAMNRGLVDLGIAERFHFAVLSDTQLLEAATQEAVWFERLLREPMSAGRIFYRRREHNTGRKAGNIEDFIARSGGAYDYGLILDADSLMAAETIGEMARRMDRDPDLGLLQTVPKVIHAQTLFGRSMQFAASYLSPSFARGAALMQGREGPYWGHNAIVRMKAFAASCGLPELSGKPPFGGHILSHDYVEAALLSRAGWKVIVDPELEGSFEEGPENLIEYAKRDRRWCQGNLQHRRLLGAPGLKFWSRFTFVQGIMAYMASPLWLLLMSASIIAVVLPEQRPVFLRFSQTRVDLWVLAAAVAVVLVLPKVLILVRGALDNRNRRFGGTMRAAASVVCEIVFSTLLAPVMLLLQTRAVAQVLLGLDGGWPATKRGQNWINLETAFRASWWIMTLGLVTLGSTVLFAPSIALWMVPAMLPAILAPLLISLSSMPSRRQALPPVFQTDLELSPAPVMVQYRAILASWIVPDVAPEPVTIKTASYVAA
ncbi:MAG: glucans biosynthesis glucosyltransferase MdoH [Devosia sp.]|nr:glucans biosynthesis glucosyltransferase MdoH [Devosia sp.]